MGRIKFPKKLKGYYEDINIVELTPAEMSRFSGKENKFQGYYDSKDTIYFINDDEALNTIFHELGHYFFMKFGISQEEFVAEAFANFTESICKQLKLI